MTTANQINSANQKKQISIPDFISILKTAKIVGQFEAQGSDTEGWINDNGDDEFYHVAFGFVYNTLTTADGLFEIFYQEGYRHVEGMPSTVEYGDNVGEPWIINKNVFYVVDEDGDEIKEWELFEIVEQNTNITDVAAIDLGDDDEEDVGMVDGNKKTRVERDNAPDIVFSMDWVCTAENSPDTAHPDYSGSTGRWWKLKLYKTLGGKFVCQKIGYTQWQGEKTRRTAIVCETEADIIKFFGQGQLAKDLYAAAEIENVETVD